MLRFINSIILFNRSWLTWTKGSSKTRHWESLSLKCLATANLTQKTKTSFNPDELSSNFNEEPSSNPFSLSSVGNKSSFNSKFSCKDPVMYTNDFFTSSLIGLITADIMAMCSFCSVSTNSL